MERGINTNYHILFDQYCRRANYIYKFYNGKLCDIEILDIHELSERENGEWVLER